MTGAATDRDARIDTLQAAVETLTGRLTAIEQVLARLVAAAPPRDGAAAAAAPTATAAVSARNAPIPEETLAVISATIAAYFGKRPRIRQVTLVGSPAWTQQGRVGIQSSHTISRG
jgi:hypothetical protein